MLRWSDAFTRRAIIAYGAAIVAPTSLLLAEDAATYEVMPLLWISGLSSVVWTFAAIFAAQAGGWKALWLLPGAPFGLCGPLGLAVLIAGMAITGVYP